MDWIGMILAFGLGLALSALVGFRFWVGERRRHRQTWEALHEMTQLAGDEQRLLNRHRILFQHANAEDFARLLDDGQLSPEDLGWVHKLVADPPREAQRARDLIDRLEQRLLYHETVLRVSPKER